MSSFDMRHVFVESESSSQRPTTGFWKLGLLTKSRTGSNRNGSQHTRLKGRHGAKMTVCLVKRRGDVKVSKLPYSLEETKQPKQQTMASSIPSGSGDTSSSTSIPQNLPISIESVRLHLASFVARYQGRVSFDTLRPLPVFLGVNPLGFCLSPGAFTPPVKKMNKESPEKIKNRIQLNLAYFLSNYVLIACMTAIVVALMHPGMILFVSIVYGLWMLHAYMIRNEVVVAGVALHALLSVQQRFYGLFVITTLVILLKCLTPALIFSSISIVLILAHAALRDPKHIEISSQAHLRGRAESDEDEMFVEEGGFRSTDEGEVLVEHPSRASDS